jgi:hypothetical protein
MSEAPPEKPPEKKSIGRAALAGWDVGMARALAIWLAATALGASLTAFLPDDLLGGGALFRLSDRHGPSPADGVGLLVVFGGCLVYLHALWARRRTLRPRWAAAALAFGAVAATVGSIAAFAADADALGFALAAAAFAAQLALSLTARNARA